MSFAGLRGVGDWGTDERPKDFRNMILRLNPNGRAPIFALTARMSREAVSDPEFSWWEEENYVPRMRHTGVSVATGSTTFTFDEIDGAGNSKGNGLDLRAGDLMMFEKVPDGTVLDDEIMEVSSITSSTVVVMKRGAAATTVIGQAAASYVIRVGNAFEDGSASPTVSSKNPTKVFNYVQQYKTAYQVTGTAEATEARTGPAMTQEQIRKAFEHSSSIEQSLIFGARSEVTGPDGEPLRTSQGILRFLTSNLTAWDDTTFTQSAMIDFFADIFNNTADGVPDQRLCYCGNSFLTKMNKVIATATNTQFQFSGTMTLYGQKMLRYITPHGEVAFKTHPLLTQNNRYNGSCIVIAPPGLRFRPLRGRDTKVDKGPSGRGIQANDVDAVKHQWMTQAGLELQHESLFGWAHYKL